MSSKETVMNEKKRRSYRTQGRHSSLDGNAYGQCEKNYKTESSNNWNESKRSFRNDTDFNTGKQRRVNSGHRNSGKSERRSAPSYSRNNIVTNGTEVVYQDGFSNDSTYSMRERPHVPKTISAPGFHVISKTERGESKIFYKPDFIEEEEGFEFLKDLTKGVNWLDKKVIIDGQPRPQPRLVAWFGPLPYSYSGVTLQSNEFPPLILHIKRKVESVLRDKNINIELNSVLLNRYRDGKDSVAWHSDDEISMGIRPTIASVSLGETRRFEMRRKPERSPSKAEAEYVVHLVHGSLIVMDGVMQLDWQHRIPKEFHDKDERINLTFRTVYPIEKIPCSRYLNNGYIPPPHPKAESTSFEYQQEAFPVLDSVASSQSHAVEKVICKSEVLQSDSESSEKKVSNCRKLKVNLCEEDNPTLDALLSHDDSLSVNEVPMSHSEDTGTWSDGACNEESTESCLQELLHQHSSSVPVNHNIVSSSEIQSANQSNAVSHKWCNPSAIKEFVPKSQNKEQFVKHSDGLSKSQSSKHATQFSNKKKFIQKERKHSRHMDKSCERRRSKSVDTDPVMEKVESREKSFVGDTSGVEREVKDLSDESEVNRLYEIYDYIGKQWNEIPFKVYHRSELNVLMTVAENSSALPIDVISLLADRMELLVQNAEHPPKTHRYIYNSNTQNSFSRRNSHYRRNQES